MSGTLITGISELVTCDPSLGEGPLGIIRDAEILIQDGKIAAIGPVTTLGSAGFSDDFSRQEVGGRAVIPGFVDSHTHLLFAGDRAAEFTARLAGEPYTAGGIHTTVAATRAASDAELRAQAARLVTEAQAQGTTTLEIKTGYGLDVDSEARLARLAREVTPEVTFLGAHVIPAAYAGDPDAYVRLVCGPMLAACAPHCRWIDVFSEEGAFNVEQAREILRRGQEAGLGLRMHAAQLGPSAAVQLAVELGAASVDHCTFLTDADVAALADSDTVATLLPGAEFSTRQPYPNARRLLDAGVTVALATDCNPGTSYTTSMPFCLALAVRELGFTPAEALLAATVGGARALRRSDIGKLSPGKQADYAILDAPSWEYLFYRPGVPLVKGKTP
ncbi:MAG: imidazolonepropionase [Propionibacteriaceae bacterium]|jgi:imidazolonepropionase|nr:imidazolonepropionase [Propionibacteriaceae bacterium]